MQTNTIQSESSQPRLRAMVEVINGELQIYPIAQTDEEANEVIEGILSWRRDG